MSKSLWQHPYVNLFKHFNIAEWKKCAKEGDVTPVMDKTLKSTVYRIAGSIPAGNYIQFPRTSTQSLNLTGRYLYVLFKPMSGKYFIAHLDIATEDGLAVRVSFSNLFKEFKSTSTWLQFPFVPRPPPGSIDEATSAGFKSQDNIGHVAVSTRYTFLMLDLQYIASVYLNQTYSHLKNIRLCANMLVKGLFTSDTEYTPGLTAGEARKLGLMTTGHLPVPRDMAFHVPKSCSWHDLYDVVKFPAKNQHIRTGIIYGDHKFDLNTKAEDTDSNVKQSVGDSTRNNIKEKHKSQKAVESRVALVDRLSPRNSKGKRRHIVATHVPTHGLEKPVGLDPEDQLDTQVYAYQTTKKQQTPSKENVEPRVQNSKSKKKKTVLPVSDTLHGDIPSKAKRGFKSLKPDPILKLRRLVGFGGATQKDVLWTRNGSCIVYPCHAVVVSMETATGHQRFFMGHTDKVSALTFNGNTTILASAQIGQSTVLRIWRYQSGDCLAIFNSQVRNLHCLSFSNSGGILCGSGQDGHGKQLVVVWDTSRCGKNGEVSVIAKAHTDVDITRLKIAPFDDTRLVSCGRDNIRFWRIRHGSLRSCAVDLGGQHSLVFTDLCFGYELMGNDNKKHRFVYVSTKSGTVYELNYELLVVNKIRRLLPTGSRQDLVGEDTSSNDQFGIGINCLTVNEAFCMTGSDDGYMRLWPLDFSGVVLEAEHDGSVAALDINPDGLSVLAATSTGNIGILDIASRSYKTMMRSHTDRILSCTFDPSRRHLVTVSKDETIRVWDLDNLSQLYDFRAPNENPCAVVYHPQQNAFACGFRNGAVRVFSIETSTMLAEYKEHRGMVTGLSFSPNGEHMFSAGSLGTMVLYEGSTDEFSVVRLLVNAVCRGEHLAPDVLSVSEDSQRVAVIGPSEFVVTVMDTRTLDEVLRIDITTMNPDAQCPAVDSAIRLCYAPSTLRQLLVVTSNCRLLKLDSHTGQLLSEVTNIHRSTCSSVATFPSGKFLATGGDKVVKIWDYHMRLDLNFQVFIGHSDVISKVKFTPDLQGVVSVGECIFIWDFLADGRTLSQPGGRSSPQKYISDEPDKSVRVSGDFVDLNSQSEQRPRDPIQAMQIPSCPQPSPSPTRTKCSPAQLLQNNEETLNPLVTQDLTAPKNTPVKDITEVSDIGGKSPTRVMVDQVDADRARPAVNKHYRRQHSSATLPARRYTAPPSQAGLTLDAVLDYNGFGRGNMVWNPETGLFAYTSSCIVILEDLHGGQQRHFLGHSEEISTIALQNDVQCLASASGSSKMVASQICIWQIETGLCKKVLTYHAHEIVCLAYSRDDRFLISVGDYRECSVVIWGTRDYNVLTSSYAQEPIHDLCWDPYTMNEFVSVGGDGSVLFWLLEEIRGTYNLNVCEAKLPDDLLYLDKETDSMAHFTCVQYAGDSILYVGNNIGILSAWDTRQNKCFMHWEADDSEIDIIVCYRGQLITGGCSGHLRLWSVVGVGEMRLPGDNNIISQDGLVIEDEMTLDASIVSAKFDASMEMGIVGTAGGTLWYINWTERTSIRLVSSHTQKINALVVSGPDDKYFATCSNDGSLRVWTSDDLEQTLQFQVMDQQCKCLAFCPTPQPHPAKNVTSAGQIIATVHPHDKPAENPVRPSHCIAGYDDGTLRLFDLGRVEMIMKVHPHATAVTAVTFSADGRVFMSGSKDGVVAISSPATGLTVRLIQDHKGAPITNMDIAPITNHHPSLSSPRLWLVTSGDRRVSVWSTDWSKDFCELVDWLTFPAPSTAPDGTVLKKGDLSSYDHLPISLARFSPCEPDIIIYTGYGLKKQIQFYSLSQRKAIRSISLTQWASSLEISPKGHLIAVGTSERLLKIVDYHEGSFQDFVGHCGQVSCVSFSPSGRKLFSVGLSDVLRWKVVF